MLAMFFCFLWGCYTTHKIRTSATNVILPGTNSLSLDAVDPKFRKKVDILIQRLEDKGYKPRVMSTYRSNARQKYLMDISDFGEKYLRLQMRYTNAGPGQSCHNNTNSKGEPASLAVDIHGHHLGFLAYISKRNREKHVAFFRDLDRERRRLGLCWGGDFSGDTIWSEYGIGSDPPHITSRRCCK